MIEHYLADQAERWKPATVAFRYRSLQQFTEWLTAEDGLPADPTAGMQAPKVPEEPVPVLSRDQLKALIAACKGSQSARVSTASVATVTTSRPRLPVGADDEDSRHVMIVPVLMAASAPLAARVGPARRSVADRSSGHAAVV